MKVVLNATPIAYPLSGVGQYTIQLGKSLETLLENDAIFWFGSVRSNGSPNDFSRANPNAFNSFRYEVKRHLRKMPGFNAMVYRLRDRQFQSYIQITKPLLYHETNYVPFHFESGPTLMTLFDLSFVRHPEWHPIDRVRFYEKYCLKQLHRATAIFTISEFSKTEIVHMLNISPSKIYVTYPGVQKSSEVKRKTSMNLPERYILYVGNIEPRKNLSTLLDSYSSLPKTIKNKYALVIGGAKGWITRSFEKKLHYLQKKERIVLAGYVSQDYLPDLYKGASLFVYPSFYEGFGLPVIEAMTYGVPIIASNVASLPEVVGDAGMLFNPYDSHDLKERIVKVLEDPKIGKALSEKGLQRAKRYSWQKCAEETVVVYRKMMGEFNNYGK